MNRNNPKYSLRKSKPKQDKAKRIERDDTMAAITKPTKINVISADKSASFIKRFNESKPSDSFMQSCKKAGELFKRK